MTEPSPPAHAQGEHDDTTPHNPQPGPDPVSAGFALRAGLGGALMGLANLVPGISGGTMLVAAGVYRPFITAIADASRFRFTPKTVLTLAVIVASAAVSIVALAGAISQALDSFRWGMYSVFIGLTLGGAPLLLAMLKPLDRSSWAGLVAGVVTMGGLVLLQATSPASTSSQAGPALLVVGGIAGASAMILPGVSGAYLLLLLGVYETIIAAIKDSVAAARDADLDALLVQLKIIVPVGVGVLIGIVGVSNLLKFVLRRYEKATIGLLLGLLLAAPLGLYPFREGVEPELGSQFEGELVTPDTLAELEPKDWPERFFAPAPLQIAGALGLAAVGFGATLGIARLGSPRPRQEQS